MWGKYILVSSSIPTQHKNLSLAINEESWQVIKTPA
jgi:hypothetical protein